MVFFTLYFQLLGMSDFSSAMLYVCAPPTPRPCGRCCTRASLPAMHPNT